MTTPLRRRLPVLLPVLPLWLAASGAWAQGSPVYRCGDGQYSATPCPGGQALDASDPRTEAQRRQAQDSRQREADLARRLEAERHQRERAATGQQAVRIGPPAASAAASAASAVRHRHAPKKPPAPPKPGDAVRVPAPAASAAASQRLGATR